MELWLLQQPTRLKEHLSDQAAGAPPAPVQSTVLQESEPIPPNVLPPRVLIQNLGQLPPTVLAELLTNITKVQQQQQQPPPQGNIALVSAHQLVPSPAEVAPSATVQQRTILNNAINMYDPAHVHLPQP